MAAGFTPNGTILGVLIDAAFVNHGFLLDKNGAFTMFDAPDAGTRASTKVPTLGESIRMETITGCYVDEANVYHGFVRDKHGAIVEFDVPGAANMAFWASIAPNGAVRRILLRREQRGSRLRARSGWTLTPAE